MHKRGCKFREMVSIYRLLLISTAFIASAVVATAQNVGRQPLKMVETDSVVLYDFFWCDAQRWAYSTLTEDARSWPWQRENLTDKALSRRVAEWERSLLDMRLEGSLCDSVRKVDEVLPMLRETVELGWQTREARFFDVAERMMTNVLMEFSKFYPLWNMKHDVLARVMGSVGSVAYATCGHDIYVNMLMRSNVHVSNGDVDFCMQIFNSAPWYNDTSIRITKDMNPVEAVADTVLSPYHRLIVREESGADSLDLSFHIRIPSWTDGKDMLPTCKAQCKRQPVIIMVNGNLFTPEMENGYAVISGRWAVGDLITIKVPTPILRVFDSRQPGMVALQRGPIVYSFDNLYKGMVFDSKSTVSHYFDNKLNAIVLKGKVENSYGRLDNAYVPAFIPGSNKIFEKVK